MLVHHYYDNDSADDAADLAVILSSDAPQESRPLRSYTSNEASGTLLCILSKVLRLSQNCLLSLSQNSNWILLHYLLITSKALLIFTVIHAQLNCLAELEAPVVLVNRTALLEIAQGERSSGIKFEELTSLLAQLNRLVVTLLLVLCRFKLSLTCLEVEFSRGELGLLNLGWPCLPRPPLLSTAPNLSCRLATLQWQPSLFLLQHESGLAYHFHVAASSPQRQRCGAYFYPNLKFSLFFLSVPPSDGRIAPSAGICCRHYISDPESCHRSLLFLSCWRCNLS